MKRVTLRIDDYTYKKILLMSQKYGMTVNSMLIELIQIGYLFKENETNIDKEIN